jgi:hypothetical protein
MAKKVVASVVQIKKHTKVIKMVRSPKTGAYTFKETVVPNEKVNEFLKNDKNTN